MLRTAAILSADVVGYSRLMASAEEETLHRLADLQATAGDIIAKVGGRTFNTAGDAIRAEFPNGLAAVEAALALQENLRVRNASYPLARQMMVRIGIAIGDVAEQAGDLHGASVTEANALEALAAPGGVCLSKAVHETVSDRYLGRFADLGIVRPPAIPAGLHAYTLIVGDTGSARSPIDPTPRAERAKTKAGYPMKWIALTLIAVVAALGSVMVLQPQLLMSQSPSQTATSTVSPPQASQQRPQPQPSVPVPAAPVAPAPAPAPQVAPSPTAPAATKASEQTDWAGLQARLKRQYTDCDSAERTVAIPACRGLLKDGALSTATAADVQAKLGIALRETGRTDEAIEALTAAIKLAPSAAAHNARGLARFEKGTLDTAIEDFTAALKLKADDGEAYNNRAWTHFKAKRLTAAADDAKQATRLSANAAYVWDTSGHIAEALGRKQAAIEDFRRAVSLDSKLQSSRDGLARLGATP